MKNFKTVAKYINYQKLIRENINLLIELIQDGDVQFDELIQDLSICTELLSLEKENFKIFFDTMIKSSYITETTLQELLIKCLHSYRASQLFKQSENLAQLFLVDHPQFQHVLKKIFEDFLGLQPTNQVSVTLYALFCSKTLLNFVLNNVHNAASEIIKLSKQLDMLHTVYESRYFTKYMIEHSLHKEIKGMLSITRKKTEFESLGSNVDLIAYIAKKGFFFDAKLHLKLKERCLNKNLYEYVKNKTFFDLTLEKDDHIKNAKKAYNTFVLCEYLFQHLTPLEAQSIMNDKKMYSCISESSNMHEYIKNNLPINYSTIQNFCKNMTKKYALNI